MKLPMSGERNRRFLVTAIAAALSLAGLVLTVMLTTDFAGPVDNFRLEAAKLILQFLLVGVAGGLVVAYFNHRRDEAEREAAQRAKAAEKAAADLAAAQELAAVRRTALQELIRQIGDAHRRLKVVKRQMRAAIAREEPDPRDPPNRPYMVPAGAFERAMEALLNAQISAEEVSDRVAISVDLLSDQDRPYRYGSAVRRPLLPRRVRGL